MNRANLYSPPHRRATRSVNGIGSAIQPTRVRGYWATWKSITLRISGLLPRVTPRDIWQSFSRYGSIEFIEIFEDSRGRRDGGGKVRFRPPPKQEFWTQGYDLKLEDGSQVILSISLEPRRFEFEVVPSPTRQGVTYPASIDIPIPNLEIGSLVGKRKFLSLFSIQPGAAAYSRIEVGRREFQIFFQVIKYVRQPNTNSPAVLHGHYRFQIPFVQLSTVYQVVRENESSLIIPLDSPPVCHRRIQNIDSIFSKSSNVWNLNDSWYRQTDIAHNYDEMGTAPINLKKSQPIIDIGRWTTLRISFGNAMSAERKARLTKLQEIFTDFNIDIQRDDHFDIVEADASTVPVWHWIDAPLEKAQKKSSLDDLVENDYIPLPFSVRYQLEVCISHGYLNEYAMKKDFVIRLSALEEEKAKRLLEYVATNKATYFDPMEIFDIPLLIEAPTRPIPKYCCHMRTALITPTTVYYNTPSVDTSNRVVRQYIEYADRFLRVRFADENRRGRINSTQKNTMESVFTRIKRALTNGITIDGRRYEFLAFGNSQLREHGAYFFAGLPNLNASDIRAWMGHFSNIRNVAKHAARLGQCFSTTRAVNGTPVQIKEIPDLERNGFVFSDGVGRISRFLAQMVMTEFKIKTPNGDPPSVFQFRLGGRKGILTVSPDAHRGEVHIRPSQDKFPAVHNGLEIIRYSNYCMAALNRQLIIVLSALGVPDEVFLNKLSTMLEDLKTAMTSPAQAVHMLQKQVDPNQMTLVLANMVQDGFQKSRDPFVTSLLELWRAWEVKYLKEKAKICVDEGACLLGCVDETATLKGYFNINQPSEHATREEKVACLPEIFIQVHRPEKDRYEIIQGLCLLARNPSLHPGDIRVVNAVDVPALHYLKDVVVLPQTGDRDIASMCSGGDLDGDDYLVIWDKDLLPHKWFESPMNYAAPKPEVLQRDVTVDDITSFFVTYMKNDRLPQIAHAHLALADYLPNGVYEKKCMDLAVLHSAAVDYNKTGIPVDMSRDLYPRNWPHFMEKKHKPKKAQYQSRKILGQLYDHVERVDFRPNLQAPFDERILKSPIAISEKHVKTAVELKAQYDVEMRRIMAQHEINTEFEVWSTFVLQHANMSKDYTFHEELGRISSILRENFADICREKAGGSDFNSLAPFAIAMYKVTSDQMTSALADQGDLTEKMQQRRLPLISFPWILQPILGKIANQHFDASPYLNDTGSQTLVDSKDISSQKLPKRANEKLTLEAGVLHALNNNRTHGQYNGLVKDASLSNENFRRTFSGGSLQPLALFNDLSKALSKFKDPVAPAPHDNLLGTTTTGEENRNENRASTQIHEIGEKEIINGKDADTQRSDSPEYMIESVNEIVEKQEIGNNALDEMEALFGT